MATANPESAEESSTDELVVDADGAGRVVLDALNDPDCRAILASTHEEVLTANELSERHDVPLSTIYRKLDTLVDVGMLGELTRIQQSGKHTSEYTSVVDEVVVEMRDGGVVVRITRHETPERSPYAHLAGGD